ncbi:MAG: DMT family transporter [Synergistaceae bacterium]|nr:DMT family transporter [Synergistaceae bacterium]
MMAAVCWGISPILQKRALGYSKLMELNAIRGAGVLMLLLPLFFFVKTAVSISDAKHYAILAFVAFVNNLIGDLFAFAAIRYVGVSLATPITNAYPLIIVLTSWFWFGETMTAFVLGGTLSVVAGLVLLNVRNAAPSRATVQQFHETVQQSRETVQHLRGVASAIMAALCWAFGLSLNKYLTLHGVTSTGVVFWRGIFFSLLALGNWAILKAFHPAETRSLKEVPAAGKLAGVLAGILSLVLGAGCYTFSITRIPMNVATPIATSCPLITALIACAFIAIPLWISNICIAHSAMAPCYPCNYC